MRKIKILIIVLGLVLLNSSSFSQQIKPEEVKKVMEKVADWQIEHFDECYSGRKSPHHELFWANAALYVGMVEWAAMSNVSNYYECLKRIGDNQYFRG